MAFTLPELPYAKDALAPHISAETLEFHHGKHHATYVTNLNKFVDQDPSLQGKSLEDIIRTSKGPVFNNAAQVWNHTFYWHSMRPGGGGEPTGAIKGAIDKSFGSFATFKEQFSAKAVGHFASGWAWLVKNGDKLEIVDTHDAGTPLTMDRKPILTCDVWEHAYYVDYRNARAKYVESWWNLVNWDHANSQL
ncbi:superoxide dismutase [Sandaracinus amylolyticus]|uniref:Superoxide dismutase n=1 Tax=Sandaracinus amylolyticus TaxID=927083 RepID=A0A0F6YK52_9BACT|nr:superoxide dismutase [Sandaracinus amylolyticus]AKF07951.1 Superoxide dismutase [Sandaracinus amylolyticus]